MERTILHCDCNSFYASVELLSRPELRDRPVAVCGDPASRHGIILAKNEAAKGFGVQTAETVWQARRKCPQLVLLPAHHQRYRQYSQRVNAIYERFTDLVEPFGIDESWLDVTGSLHLFGDDPVALADRIRSTIREELGLTVSVGVSFNKIFAKLGSDYRKPDATTLISPENYRQLVWPLPVSHLLFVGRATARTLEQYGIHTIGQLAAAQRDTLVNLLGKAGGQLWGYANGLEHSPVAPAGRYTPPKSIGNGLTFPQNLTHPDQVRHGLAMLCDEVAVRLRQHRMKAATLQVTIRDPHFRDICRQKPLDTPTCTARALTRHAVALVERCWTAGAPIRALTVTAQSLLPEEEAAEQPTLFDPQAPLRQARVERLERTMDAIRSRFGDSALTTGRLAPAPSRPREAEEEDALPF